jgi:hypothetical protein
LSGQYTCRWFQESDLTLIYGLNVNSTTSTTKPVQWKMGIHLEPRLRLDSRREHHGPVAFTASSLRVRRATLFTVIQGCDGFAEPEHRHMGLFQETLRFMFREFAAAGPEMLMGFNFSGSAGAAQKVGSTLIGDVHALCAKAGDLPGGASKERTPSTSSNAV